MDRLHQYLIEDIWRKGRHTFTVRRDDVATLAETPGDGVEEPQERGETATGEENLADVTTKGRGVAASLPSEHVEDVEEGGTSKDKVAPLVAAVDKGADQSSHDHDLVDENGPQNSRPGHAGGQEQVEEQQRSGDEPVNVADIEDVAVGATDDRVVAGKFNGDGSPSEVGAHGEVGDRGNHGDAGGDVVEDTVLAGLGETQADEGEGGRGHDCADGPVPVGTVSGDGDVSGGAIDGACCEEPSVRTV